MNQKFKIVNVRKPADTVEEQKARNLNQFVFTLCKACASPVVYFGASYYMITNNLSASSPSNLFAGGLMIVAMISMNHYMYKAIDMYEEQLNKNSSLGDEQLGGKTR